MAEPGCLHDAHFQNLEVSGSLAANLTTETVAAQTAITTAVVVPLSGAGAIDSNTHFVIATSGVVTNQIYLPPPIKGKTIIIIATAPFELITASSGTVVTINGGNATSADNKPILELEIAIHTIVIARATSDSAWLVSTVVGASSASAPTPDAL